MTTSPFDFLFNIYILSVISDTWRPRQLKEERCCNIFLFFLAYFFFKTLVTRGDPKNNIVIFSLFLGTSFPVFLLIVIL